MSEHAHPNYVKIWAILVVLLVVSILGPMLEMPLLTLITAFGIAIVKALMVAGFFMHLKFEKRYIRYLLFTVLALLLVVFSGSAPDVLKHAGTNWVKIPAATAAHVAPAAH